MGSPSLADFNDSVILVGNPGTGKTTIARGEVLEHLHKYPTGRVFVHDPNGQFRDLCATYPDAEAWRAAAREASSSGKPFARGAAIGGSAAELTRLCIELGRQFNRAGCVRVPIKLVFDESSLVETSGSTYMGALDTELLANRRHMGIATLHNVQRVTALPEPFYTMATRVYIFTQPSERRTRVLEEYLGLSDGELAELVGAPRFHYKLWKSGEGLVRP